MFQTGTQPAEGGVEPDALSLLKDQTATIMDDTPENACINYDRCNNEVPGNGLICADCLDYLRQQNG